MLKQLRIRFVAIAMVSMLVITTLVVGTINIVNYANEKSVIKSTLDYIELSGGVMRPFDGGMIPGNMNGDNAEFASGTNNPNGQKNQNSNGVAETSTDDNANGDYGPPGFSEDNEEFKEQMVQMREKMEFGDETLYTTRYFTVFFDENCEVTGVNIDSIAAYTEDQAQEIAEEKFSTDLLDDVKKDGSYYYTVRKSDNGYMFIYLDCSESLNQNKRLFLISIMVALASLVLEFIICTLLSKRVVKPVVESVEKQKTFITDASHELKTPLTIISANTEVIEMMEGSNEWTDSIKNQTTRLTKLVNEMVYLAKMDEERPMLTIRDFSLSSAVEETVMPFKTVAEGKGLKFLAEIEEGIKWSGDETATRQLISIFMDNAMKYTTEKGSLNIKLYRKGHHSTLTVANSCAPMSKEEINKLFERFYRVDKSRSRETGGSGIGLSIAKAIADGHKNMELSVSSPKEKTIEFKVRFK